MPPGDDRHTRHVRVRDFDEGGGARGQGQVGHEARALLSRWTLGPVELGAEPRRQVHAARGRAEALKPCRSRLDRKPQDLLSLRAFDGP